MAVSKFQNFDTETIRRDQIHNAEYNPRLMDEEAKKRLRKSIRESGLVSALTWNRRTGNLVGGHQRLAQLDALEKSADYELTVCVVDVSEKEEARLNVQLNNTDSQGYFDVEALAGLAEEFDLSMEEMGFSETTAEFLFDGDERFSTLYDTPEADAEKGKLRAIKEDRANMKERHKQEQAVNWYTVIVFANEEERKAFHKEIHVPLFEEYVAVEQVYRLRGLGA